MEDNPFCDDGLWVQLTLDLEPLLFCQCCGGEAETRWSDGRLICYPCAYDLAN